MKAVFTDLYTHWSHVWLDLSSELVSYNGLKM